MPRNLVKVATGFSQKAIDDVLKIVNERKEEMRQGVLGGNITNKEHRSSKILWLNDLNWIRDYVFYQWCLPANAEMYGYHIDNMTDIQYTEYHGSEKGRFDWHHDTMWRGEGEYQRKISMSILLNDPSEYEGGSFEFENTGPLPITERGTVIVFPSYLQHRVTPVTKGVRKSLVFWFEGPRFR